MSLKFSDYLNSLSESSFSFKYLSELIRAIPNYKGQYLNWKSNGEWEFSSKETLNSYLVDKILTYSHNESERDSILNFIKDVNSKKINP